MQITTPIRSNRLLRYTFLTMTIGGLLFAGVATPATAHSGVTDSATESAQTAGQSEIPVIAPDIELGSVNPWSSNLFVLQQTTNESDGASGTSLDCDSGFGQFISQMYDRALTLLTSLGVGLAIVGWQWVNIKQIISGDMGKGGKAQTKNSKRKIVSAGLLILSAPYLGLALLWLTGVDSVSCISLNPF